MNDGSQVTLEMLRNPSTITASAIARNRLAGIRINVVNQSDFCRLDISISTNSYSDTRPATSINHSLCYCVSYGGLRVSF